MGQLLMTAEQVADALQISRSSVYKLIGSGKLRSLKIGRSRRLVREQVEEWSRQQTEIDNQEA